MALIVFGLIAGVVIGVLCVVMIPLVNALNIDSTIATWAIFILGGIITYIIYKIYCRIFGIADDSKYVKYDEKEKTLYVFMRDSKAIGSITIKQFEYDYFKLNPAELVYTGATVGNITTGGFHINPAYYSVGFAEKTDKFELHYGNSGVIKKICCSFDVGNSKKIKKYKVDDYTLLLENTPKQKKINEGQAEQMAKALRNEDYTAMSILAKDSILEKKLSYTECQNVLLWLSNSD